LFMTLLMVTMNLLHSHHIIDFNIEGVVFFNLLWGLFYFYLCSLFWGWGN
jgi:hypothetical protein